MFNVEEFIKCRESFPYFAKTYLKIKHSFKGLIPFELHKYQEILTESYSNYRFVAVKKFRQSGITTLTVLWVLWKCMFFNDQRVFIASKTDREAKHLAKLIDLAIYNLPSWLKPHFTKRSNFDSIIEETGSTFIFSTLEPCRSRALTYLIIDEAAFIPNMKEHWDCIYPTLSTGGNAIIMSTINGDNWFSRLWTDALEGRNTFNAVQVHFWEHPDYNNPAWTSEMKKNLGEKAWREEILGEVLDPRSPEVLKMCADHASSLTSWQLAQRIRSIAGRFKNKKDVETYAFLLEAYNRLEKEDLL